MSGNLEVRPYRPGDEARILDTFNLVFRRECGPGFRDRDLEYWRWQYQENPAGQQILLAVDADGTVAAQYAAVPQRADTMFGPVRFVHVVDSMTHPAYRAGLQRTGVFATLGRAFTADYREHGNELGYGFPVRAAERIGSRMLGYELLRPIDYLVRSTDVPVPAAPAGVEVTQVRGWPPEVDELWQRCLPERPCTVRRDRRYLHWRYVQIPTRRDYELFVAHRQGELSGLLVLRPYHELVPSSGTIVDQVWHDDDEEHDAPWLPSPAAAPPTAAARTFSPSSPTAVLKGRSSSRSASRRNRRPSGSGGG